MFGFVEVGLLMLCSAIVCMCVQEESWQIVNDLLQVGIGAIIKDAKAYDPERTKFGFIPFMAKTYLGRLLAEPFCERMISHANIVMSKCNAFL